MVKTIRSFIALSGVLLLMTAIVKLVSATGSARILQMPDPILGISFRADFFIAGAVELLVAIACLVIKGIKLRAGLLVWLTTNFALYRLGLWAAGWHHPCPCLGNFTDALHIPHETAGVAMKIILAYLLIGSYGTLVWLWRRNRKTRQTRLPESAAANS